MFFGILAMLVILAAGGERCVTVTTYRDASAIQVIQLYSEGMFFVLVVLGALVAFYVAVRPD